MNLKYDECGQSERESERAKIVENVLCVKFFYFFPNIFVYYIRIITLYDHPYYICNNYFNGSINHETYAMKIDNAQYPLILIDGSRKY